MGTGWLRLRRARNAVRVRFAMDQERFALGDLFDVTPFLVIPVRAHLNSVKRLLKGDISFGRGSRQRTLPRSRYCNNSQVSVNGREAAIAGFREMLLQDRVPYSSLWTLSGTRLVCHCRESEACHGDVLVEEFRKAYPRAYDRTEFNYERSWKVMTVPALTKGPRPSYQGIADLESPCKWALVTCSGTCAMGNRSHLPVAGLLVFVFTRRRITGIESRTYSNASQI